MHFRIWRPSKFVHYRHATDDLSDICALGPLEKVTTLDSFRTVVGSLSMVYLNTPLRCTRSSPLELGIIGDVALIVNDMLLTEGCRLTRRGLDG